MGDSTSAYSATDALRESAALVPTPAAAEGELEWHLKLGFCLSGLYNNAGFVIMIAGAKSIDPSMVGLVYVCSVMPSMMVKGSGPYWFHYLSYRLRMIIVCLCMAASFILAALGETDLGLGTQLLGVCIGSAGSALGEASFLSLAGFYPSRSALTAWSCGTGLAGLIGYGWVIFFTLGLGWSFANTSLLACIIPVAFWFNFTRLMGNPSLSRERHVDVVGNIGQGQESDNKEDLIRKLSSDQPSHGASSLATRCLLESGTGTETSSAGDDDGDGDGKAGIMAPKKRAAMEAATLIMTTRERFDNTLALWPYMVPLFVVFYSEYVIQSGVWSAMGLPPSDKDSRAKFYSYSNWCYQAGVLVSRSSGTTFTASMELLWLMPLIQAGMLLFFTLEAFFLFWNEWSLLPVCFVVGLLGGAVYVQGFSKISECVPPHLKEFSLSAASVADSTGTTLATVTGIFVQQAIYNYHNLKDDDDA